MTPAQRSLRTKWMIAATLLVPVVVFDGFVESNAGWLRWILLAGVAFASVRQRRSRSELGREGRANLASLLESAPWLKAWFTAWAAVAFFGAIYATRRDIDLFRLFGGIRFLVVSFAILAGPVLVLNERRRFLELGEARDGS